MTNHLHQAQEQLAFAEKQDKGSQDLYSQTETILLSIAHALIALTEELKTMNEK